MYMNHPLRSQTSLRVAVQVLSLLMAPNEAARTTQIAALSLRLPNFDDVVFRVRLNILPSTLTLQASTFLHAPGDRSQKRPFATKEFPGEIHEKALARTQRSFADGHLRPHG